MKNLVKCAALFVFGLLMAQTADAQFAVLGNGDVCPTLVELTWETSPCSGARVTTMHLVPANTNITVAAPNIGAYLHAARVTYSGQTALNVLLDPCGSYVGGHNIPAINCTGGSTLLQVGEPFGPGGASYFDINR